MQRVIEQIKAFLRREPVVVINGVVAAAVTVQQAVTADLAPTDGWGAVAWAVFAYVVRSQVRPAKETLAI